MTATATYDSSTRTLAVTGDGLPDPVSYGTFPNVNNPNSVTEQAFAHTFYYRGGTFGISRTFDDTSWTQEGFIRSVNISVNDNSLFDNQIQSGDHLLFVFSDGIKQRFVYQGTTFTSSAGNCWLATDQRLDLIMANSESGTSGTCEYYDQRNGRAATPLGAIGIAANGVVLFNPSAGNGGNPPAGFNWNAHYPTSPVDFGDDECGGHPEQTGQYHYHDTHFLDCWKANSIMATYNDYYGSTQYNGNNLRHPDGHSKMVGVAFDGFPIYGPFGYNDPWDNLSGTDSMVSSYSVKSEEAIGRPEYGQTQANPPAGSLMQDWEYVEGIGDLDYHNGRFCLTPEFPNGTYAYFLSLDENDATEAAFPYLIGTTTREGVNQPVNNGAATPPSQGGGGEQQGPPPTLQIGAQPQNVTTASGLVATFTLTAQVLPENGPIAYQWQRSTDGGFSFATITGATSNTYAVTAQGYMTGYRYRCELRGPLGAPQAAQNSPLLSSVATLTVTGNEGGGSGADFSFNNATFDSTGITFDGT